MVPTDLEQVDVELARYLQTANVAMAGRPAKALRSRLFDGRPQPAERGAQIFVRDFGEIGGDARRRFGIAGGAPGAVPTAQRRPAPPPAPAPPATPQTARPP